MFMNNTTFYNGSLAEEEELQPYGSVAMNHPFSLLIETLDFVFIIIIGTFLIFSLQQFSQENQYVFLSEKLLINAHVISILFHPIIQMSMYIRQIFGVLPHTFCIGFSMTVEIANLMFQFSIIEFFCVRIVVSYIWKNVGMFNDDLVIRFAYVLNFFVPTYLVICSYLFSDLKNESYCLCTGLHPNNIVKSENSSLKPHHIFGTAVFGFLAFFLIFMVKKKLQTLHQTTRDSTGLPRVGDEHPGTNFLGLILLTLVLSVISNFPGILFLDFFWDGTLDEFPNCLVFGPTVSFPSFVHLFIGPILFLYYEPTYRRMTKRNVKEMLENMKELICP